MGCDPSAEELELRERLANGVWMLQTSLAQVPAIDDALDPGDPVRLHEAGVAIADVLGAARILTRFAAELRALESVSEEGLLIVGSTTSVIAVARMAASYLRAQVDRLLVA